MSTEPKYRTGFDVTARVTTSCQEMDSERRSDVARIRHGLGEIVVTSNLVRHLSEMTMRYAHFAPEAGKAAAERLGAHVARLKTA